MGFFSLLGLSHCGMALRIYVKTDYFSEASQSEASEK